MGENAIPVPLPARFPIPVSSVPTVVTRELAPESFAHRSSCNSVCDYNHEKTKTPPAQQANTFQPRPAGIITSARWRQFERQRMPGNQPELFRHHSLYHELSILLRHLRTPHLSR